MFVFDLFINLIGPMLMDVIGHQGQHGYIPVWDALGFPGHWTTP